MGCTGPVWRHGAFRYPAPFPRPGTPCPDCGEPFRVSPGVAELCTDGDGQIDLAMVEMLRFIFHDWALALESERLLDGDGNPVRRRLHEDRRRENAGLHGLLEGQEDRIRDIFGDE